MYDGRLLHSILHSLQLFLQPVAASLPPPVDTPVPPPYPVRGAEAPLPTTSAAAAAKPMRRRAKRKRETSRGSGSTSSESDHSENDKNAASAAARAGGMLSSVNTPSDAACGSATAVTYDDDSTLCCICLTQLKCMVVIPCGHICLCGACATASQERRIISCPICKGNIQGIFRIFQ
jgi:hypothetical protein